MQKLDMYTEQRRSTETLEYMMATSDTMRDANETLSKSLLLNILEFLMKKNEF